MMETEKTGGRIPEDARWSESLKKAKEILAEGKDTCVLVKDDIVLTSRVRGVQPFLDWMADGTDLPQPTGRWEKQQLFCTYYPA